MNYYINYIIYIYYLIIGIYKYYTLNCFLKEQD